VGYPPSDFSPPPKFFNSTDLGQKATLRPHSNDVRFTPESGHW
jgi:hypothetical protein